MTAHELYDARSRAAFLEKTIARIQMTDPMEASDLRLELEDLNRRIENHLSAVSRELDLAALVRLKGERGSGMTPLKYPTEKVLYVPPGVLRVSITRPAFAD